MPKWNTHFFPDNVKVYFNTAQAELIKFKRIVSGKILFERLSKSYIAAIWWPNLVLYYNFKIKSMEIGNNLNSTKMCILLQT